MKTVQLLGVAPNVRYTPNVEGERWGMNYPRAYCRRGFAPILATWTRWFNMHSQAHINKAYKGWNLDWYFAQRPGHSIYLQAADPLIPASVTYPREAIQEHFRRNGHPENFFTCSLAWMMALAIYDQFERIELWGFSGAGRHESQQPALAFWVDRARKAGIDVIVPDDVTLVEAPADPQYTGPLYGYETT